MINEERVRLMTKMAAYEQGEGRENLKILEFYKEDYTSRKMIRVWLNTTIAFVILLGIYGLACMDRIFLMIQVDNFMSEMVIFLFAYLIYEIFFLVAAFGFYRKKYKRALVNTKEYYKNLKRLERLYEKEQGGRM